MKNLIKTIFIIVVSFFSCKKEEEPDLKKEQTGIDNEIIDIGNEYFIQANEYVEKRIIYNDNLTKAVFDLGNNDEYPKFSVYYITWDSLEYLRFDSLFSADHLQQIIEKVHEKDLNSVRIFESIFFDESDNKIKTKIIAAAPLRSVYDDYGEFLGSIPLFYVKFE